MTLTDATNHLAAAQTSARETLHLVQLLEKWNRSHTRRYREAAKAHREAAKALTAARCVYAETLEGFRAGKVDWSCTRR